MSLFVYSIASQFSICNFIIAAKCNVTAHAWTIIIYININIGVLYVWFIFCWVVVIKIQLKLHEHPKLGVALAIKPWLNYHSLNCFSAQLLGVPGDDVVGRAMSTRPSKLVPFETAPQGMTNKTSAWFFGEISLERSLGPIRCSQRGPVSNERSGRRLPAPARASLC